MSTPAPRVAYVIPTHNRPMLLARTLDRIDRLGGHDASVVVVDNASEPAALVPDRLGSGVPVRAVRLDENLAAAARNVGVRTLGPDVQWVVMLDDDSSPMDLGFLDVLARAPDDVSAIGAEILLPPHADDCFGSHRHESGGLPEVVIGCGFAVRRADFAGLGGYDAGFDYYAEEYDLCARLLLAGGRVVHDPRFRVVHEKAPAGRDFGRIVARLVRNNAWVAQRYAPTRRRARAIAEIVSRYRGIAEKESASAGFSRGLAEAMRTLARQPRTPMPADLWDRFTGKAAARETIASQLDNERFSSASIITPGKHADVVRGVLREAGVCLVDDAREADALVIGTLSPGPIADAWQQRPRDRRVIAPYPVFCGGGGVTTTVSRSCRRVAV